MLAAANGGDPRYLPVPIMTVPPTAPPRPPMASIPQPPTAPDPAMYVNAFSPPVSADAAAKQQQMGQQGMMMPMGYYPGPAPIQ